MCVALISVAYISASTLYLAVHTIGHRRVTSVVGIVVVIRTRGVDVVHVVCVVRVRTPPPPVTGTFPTDNPMLFFVIGVSLEVSVFPRTEKTLNLHNQPRPVIDAVSFDTVHHVPYTYIIKQYIGQVNCLLL